MSDRVELLLLLLRTQRLRDPGLLPGLLPLLLLVVVVVVVGVVGVVSRLFSTHLDKEHVILQGLFHLGISVFKIVFTF